MTAEQATALIIAVTGLLSVMAAILAQVRQTHMLVNGRLTQLLDTTKLAAQKIGELTGRDFEAANPRAAPTAVGQTSGPTA